MTPAITFIFITLVLDMLALGLIVPVLPGLIVEFSAGDTARGAEIFGLFATVFALMQFLFSPLLGVLSDRYGRRPVILLSNFGLGLDYILMALAPSLWFLFVGRVIAGITAASFSIGGAYIADVTPPEKRAAGFAIMNIAFGLGFIGGPAFGGLLGAIDPRMPFWVAAGLSLANGLYGLFVLPESLPPERRSNVSWDRANPIGSIGLVRSHPELFVLAIVTFLVNIAHEALPTVFVLYATYRYGWDASTIGLSVAVVGACATLVGGFLVRPAVARFGERMVMMFGLSCAALGFAIFGFASTPAVFWIGVPVNALWGLAGPAMMGFMSRRVLATEQGQLQGALGSIRGIAFMIGPVLFTQTFSTFIDPQFGWHVPGAPFLLAGLLILVAVILAQRATRPEDMAREPGARSAALDPVLPE